MSLVPSLLQAIVRIDGDALVMHAGDKPYVVSPTGQIDLASRGLALDAVEGILTQLLSPESHGALDEFGAVQYDLPTIPDFPGERFTVVAARGGEDLWVEVRRHRIPDEDRVPEEFFSTPSPASARLPREPAAGTGEVGGGAPLEADEERLRPEATRPFPGQAGRDDVEIVAAEAPSDAPPSPMPPPEPPPVAEALPPVAVVAEPPATPAPPQAVAGPKPIAIAPESVPPPAPVAAPPAPPVVVLPSVTAAPPPPPSIMAGPPAPVASLPVAASPPSPSLPSPPQQAVVLPMARNPVRTERPMPSMGDPTMDGLQRLLRISAARGASTLYLSSESKPSVRVDGELQNLEGEPLLSSRDVESLLLTLMPERSHEALRTGAATEWICDIEEVGRVRCMGFRDHAGPGGVFRLMPTRTVSADQLGLPRAIQALAIEPEGVVLVVGPRSSGKRTLISAFVDLINRSRRDHVITIEREINIVHPRGSSFISQREVRGDDDEMLAAARAALREDPDVLVVEDLRTGGLMNVALEAASSGRLVIGGFPAHTATAAVDRIIDLYAPEHRRQVQFALADNLRGVIAQLLLRKVGGGRTPARELLLNTPAVSSVIAEGKTSQLPMAIEGGRRHGMMPLSDSLVGLVQAGLVDAPEAYRHAGDRAGLVAALKRNGVDTSFVERLA